MSKTKKKAPTSKKLAIMVSVVWVMTVILSFVCLLLDKDSGFILNAVSASFSVILSGYFTKSFFENKEQYGGSAKVDNSTFI